MAKNIDSIFFDITPKIEELALKCEQNNAIEKELYTKYEVKRGLRDLNGKGVLAGLTNISDVCASKIVDGKSVPCEGNLYYRGYNIKDLVRGFLEADHPGFEETAYLLLFGELPNKAQLEEFQNMIAERRMLPPNFVRDVIMKAPSRDMMNSITRSILQLYSYDEKADDTSIPNVLRQCLNLISQFPMLMVYGYHAYNYRRGEDLYIYAPKAELSTAENILMMLREDRKYTKLEAEILDMALVLHMDHGGGNNSTFTTHVVTSSGTDTYSTIAAAMASLKGPKHGGANIKVTQMFEDMKREVSDPTDEAEVTEYLKKLLRREAFDRKGLIYGMGHAVYTLSDPRSEILKAQIEILAQEMFRAGSNLKGKSAQDICFLDFKKFTVNETVFGVGQVNSMSSDELEGIKKKVKPYLEKACADSGVNMIFFMLTNILTESSELLCGGPEAKEKILNAYDLPEDTDTIMLKGVVSRKKQLVPTLVSVLQQ